MPLAVLVESVLVLLVLLGTTSASRSSNSSKPNFVIFLQDDQDFLNGRDGLRPM